MEELSGYDYLLGREAIQLLEIEETVRDGDRSAVRGRC
jgi:hypothetical protein